MRVSIVEGDLLDQTVDALVCPVPSRCSGWQLGAARAIRRRAGRAPFDERKRFGRLVPGSVAMTGAGNLQARAVLHAVTVGRFPWAFEADLREAVRNLLALARRHSLRSIALPLLGAGGGARTPEFVLRTLCDELQRCDYDGVIRIVVHPPSDRRRRAVLDVAVEAALRYVILALLLG